MVAMGRGGTLSKSYHGYVHPMVMGVLVFCFITMGTKGVLGTRNDLPQALHPKTLGDSCLVVSSTVEQVCSLQHVFSLYY